MHIEVAVSGGGKVALSKITNKRQVVIPENICKAMGAKPGDYVEFIQKDNDIVLKPKKVVDAALVTWNSVEKQPLPPQTRQDRLEMLKALQGDAEDDSGDIPIEKIKEARTVSTRIPEFD